MVGAPAARGSAIAADTGPAQNKKSLCNETFFFLMGRLMGFEPTSDGATIRCVNHFTTIAMRMMYYT